jgi:hypothetical protein
MKNFDLSSMGVCEMNTLEMQETDGGIIWFIVAAVVILLAADSCSNNNITVQVGSVNTSNQAGGGTMTADSTLNGNHLQVPVLK